MPQTALEIDNLEKTLIIKRLSKSMSSSVERVSSSLGVVHWGLPSQSRPGYSGYYTITGNREDDLVYGISAARRLVLFMYSTETDHRISDIMELNTFGK